MGYVIPLALGIVAVVFLLMVTGEVFYLLYRRKRPNYPRGSNVSVAPVSEGEAATQPEPAEASSDVVINVTCAEYQIAALHQDLVEKLFPALGVTTREDAQNLMGPTRMLFTITEETKEELEKLDLDNKRSRRASSRSKSMSELTVSPAGPLSPLSSPFLTPPSSPEHFVTPYGTPTYSPLVNLGRSRPPMLKSPSRPTNDHLTGSPPPGPPSPTRPSFPFLSRGSSPSRSLSPDTPSRLALETSEWCSPQNISSKNSPGHPLSTFYSPPRKPFIFATPVVHGKKVEGVVKGSLPLRSCTYVYENGTFSPSHSPQRSAASPLLACTLGDHFARDKQWGSNLSSSTPPQLSPTGLAGQGPPFFSLSTPRSDTLFATSPSCKPSSQRSSSVLFPSSFSRPALIPPPSDQPPTASVSGTDSSSPTSSISSLSQSSWTSMSSPFIVEPSSCSTH